MTSGAGTGGGAGSGGGGGGRGGAGVLGASASISILTSVIHDCAIRSPAAFSPACFAPLGARFIYFMGGFEIDISLRDPYDIDISLRGRIFRANLLCSIIHNFFHTALASVLHWYGNNMAVASMMRPRPCRRFSTQQ